MDIGKVPSALIAPKPVGDMSVGSGLVGTEGASSSFADALKQAVNVANSKAIESDVQVQQLVVGEGSVHKTMIAMQESGIAMEMVLAVRNKALEAYHEVMRMPV
ncbi:MAG: flagellar hook-basal body complex protein FliE [Leptospirillia bacterium]